MSAEQRDRIRRRLVVVGRRRSEAVIVLYEADAALAKIVVEADDAAVPRLTIAREAGIARETVYKILAKHGRHTRAQLPELPLSEISTERSNE